MLIGIYSLSLKSGRSIFHISRFRLFSSSATKDSTNIVNRLESLKLESLKEVYKKLGGKPGNLRKADLVDSCRKLLEEKVDTIQNDSIETNANQEQTIDIIPEEYKSSDESINNYAVKVKASWEPSSHRISHSENLNKNMKLNPANKVDFDVFDDIYEDPLIPLNEAELQTSQAAKFPVGPNRDNRFNFSGGGDMELSFLGTASCIPSVTRGVSCVSLRINSDIWLFDCGESTQIQLQRSRVRCSKIKKIFLTHSHGDHSFGLAGVLCLMGQARQHERALALANDEEFGVVDIYGPVGTRDYVRAVLQLTYSRVGVPHRIHELKNIPFLHGRYAKIPTLATVKTRMDPYYGEQDGGTDIYPNENGEYFLFDEDGYKVHAAPLQHTVPCVGYVVSEISRPGSLRAELVQDLIIKNKDLLKKQLSLNDHNKVFRILKALNMSDSFQFPDGTVVHARDIIEPPKKGRKVVILGDTCNTDRIIPLARDADVLIHEATNAYFPETDKKYSTYSQLERDAIMHGHSTPQMAGLLAKQINAKRLVLTHFSARYRGDDSYFSMSTMWRIEDMAREVCHLKDKNDIIAAWDQMTIPVFYADNEILDEKDLKTKESSISEEDRLESTN